MPVYKCTSRLAKSNAESVEVTQLVEAKNESAAIRYVAAGIIQADVCTTAEAVELGARGIKLEQAA